MGKQDLNVCSCQVRIVARVIRKMGSVFHKVGREGWIDGVSKDQLRMAPRNSAFKVNSIIGSEQSMSESVE